MELNIRPTTEAERMYFYRNSQQISMQTGHIGYLRADMDSNGKGFFSTWNGFRDDFKTDGFKREFDEVINSLRFDEQCGGMLKSRTAMKRYCHAHEDAGFSGSYTREYGFRVDTEKHTYLMRVNPTKGDYNLYCYCYVKEWFNGHLERAKQGIRFITPHYQTLFRLEDGEKVRIRHSDGKSNDYTCRYIDQTHCEVGSNLYHICEFAEIMEGCGNVVVPLRSSLPERCYATLPSNGRLIVITKGEKGYTDVSNEYDSPERNKELAQEHNAEMGVTKAQAAAMLCGSMFGWQPPGADPKNYDSNGNIIKKPFDRGDTR